MIQPEHLQGLIWDWGRTLYDNENGKFFPETRKTLNFFVNKWRGAIVSVVGKADDRVGANSIEERFQILHETNLMPMFEFALFTENTEDKPNLFRNVIGNWDLKPQQVLVVDDRMKRLVWPIQNGFQTAWLKRGKFAGEIPENSPEPGIVIASLSELVDILIPIK